MAARPPDGPPRPPFVFGVGVTGHRIDALGADSLGQLHSQLGEILALIERTAFTLLASERDCFASDPPKLCLVSPLADGADQIASEAALDLGWEVHAVLPFARDFYRSTLSNDASRETFDALLGRSSRVLELPGEQGDEPEGYAMAGRATIAHCDVLIAIWDGLKPRGRGGTGEVVELAIASGTPVIHIAPELDRPAKLLWAAFDPVVDTMRNRPDGRAAARSGACRADAHGVAVAASRQAGAPLPPALPARAPSALPPADRISPAAGDRGRPQDQDQRPDREGRRADDPRGMGGLPREMRVCRTASTRRSTFWRRPMAGSTAWRPTSPRPIAAATSSASSWAESRCAWASARS